MLRKTYTLKMYNNIVLHLVNKYIVMYGGAVIVYLFGTASMVQIQQYYIRSLNYAFIIIYVLQNVISYK